MFYDIILTVITKLTRFARFILYNIIIIAKDFAYLIRKEIFGEFNIPKKIISDRDKLFTLRFLTAFKKALEIDEGISIAFYPEIDC